MRERMLIVVYRDAVGDSLDLINGIFHGIGNIGMRQHRNVIFVVADADRCVDGIACRKCNS